MKHNWYRPPFFTSTQAHYLTATEWRTRMAPEAQVALDAAIRQHVMDPLDVDFWWVRPILSDVPSFPIFPPGLQLSTEGRCTWLPTWDPQELRPLTLIQGSIADSDLSCYRLVPALPFPYTEPEPVQERKIQTLFRQLEVRYGTYRHPTSTDHGAFVGPIRMPSYATWKALLYAVGSYRASTVQLHVPMQPSDVTAGCLFVHVILPGSSVTVPWNDTLSFLEIG